MQFNVMLIHIIVYSSWFVVIHFINSFFKKKGGIKRDERQQTTKKKNKFRLARRDVITATNSLFFNGQKGVPCPARAFLPFPEFLLGIPSFSFLFLNFLPLSLFPFFLISLSLSLFFCFKQFRGIFRLSLPVTPRLVMKKM